MEADVKRGSLRNYSKAEGEIRSAVEKFHTALLNVNEQILDELLSEELSFGHSNGKVEDKAGFITNIVNKNSVFTSIDFSEQIIKITGKTAVVRHLFFAHTNDNNKQGSVKLFILLIWQMKNRKWQLLARQAVRT